MDRKHDLDPISLDGAKNVIVSSDIKVEGDMHNGDNIHYHYYDSPESFTSPQLPFNRPTAHLSRQIFKEQDAGGSTALIFGGNNDCYDILTELSEHSYVILLGDAGIGKSTELKWLCHELKDSGEWVPIFRSLGNKKYLTDLPLFPKNIEGKTILVLDGLDESNVQDAKLAIEDFQQNFPNAKILASCRSNAYSNTLQNFEVYYLGKLAYPQIQQYVQGKLGAFSEHFFLFWKDRHHWSQNQLIDNPFFLVHICEYIRDNQNKMPDSLGQVFEYLIEKSFDIRVPIISHFGEGDLVETRRTYHNLLKKVAFVMECRGENVISKEEFAQLIPDREQRDKLLGESSLLELQENNWRFAHNNFQEYLAAKALSDTKSFKAIKKALAAKPDFQRLKWSWINSLSFLMGLWSDDNIKKKQLLDWLAKTDIEPLIKIGSFERDKISQANRERIFKLAFEACKKEDIVIGSHHYNYWNLAEFAESANTISYLIEEFKYARTYTVKSNTLVLLKAMQVAFIYDDNERGTLRRLLLQNIFDFEVNTPSVRLYSMEVLLKLYDDLSLDEAVKIVERFFDSEYAVERSSTYRIIRKQNLQGHYMEQLINRMSDINDHNWRKGEVRYADEDWQVEKCFENLDSEKLIVEFFEKYSDIIEDRRNNLLKLFNMMLEKLSSLSISNKGCTRIFEVMKSYFSELLAHPMDVKTELIFGFIEKNGLRFEFFKYCIEENAIWRSWVSTPFLDEQGIDYLVNTFKHGNIDRQWIDNYQRGVSFNKEELLPLLNQRLNEVTNEPFSLPEFKPQRNYAQWRKEKLLVEKSLYCNKDKYLIVLEEIFADFSKDSFQKNEIYEDRSKKAQVEKDHDVYDRYPARLLGLINDHAPIIKKKLIELIHKNWKWISIHHIQFYLKDHQSEIEKDPELGLNSDELDYVKKWCENHYSKFEENGKLTYADVAFVWFTIKYHFSEYPKRVYLQMLSSGIQDHVDNELDVIQFIMKYPEIPFEEVKTKALEVLSSGGVNGRAVVSIFRFIEQYNIHEALPKLPNYIEGKMSKSSYISNAALKTYIALKGEIGYLYQLFKNITHSDEDYREQTLLDYFSPNRNEDFEKILLQKLAASTAPERQIDYARYLVRQGNLTGLQFLVNYIEREKKSPFSAHVGNPDYQFENPEGIPLILRLITLGNDTSIPQDNFNSISSVGRNMLLYLAACQNRKYFTKVNKALQWYLQNHKWLNKMSSWFKKWLKITSLEDLKQLRYLLKDLEFQYYQKENVTIAESVKIWESLK